MSAKSKIAQMWLNDLGFILNSPITKKTSHAPRDHSNFLISFIDVQRPIPRKEKDCYSIMPIAPLTVHPVFPNPKTPFLPPSRPQQAQKPCMQPLHCSVERENNLLGGLALPSVLYLSRKGSGISRTSEPEASFWKGNRLAAHSRSDLWKVHKGTKTSP